MPMIHDLSSHTSSRPIGIISTMIIAHLRHFRTLSFTSADLLDTQAAPVYERRSHFRPPLHVLRTSTEIIFRGIFSILYITILFFLDPAFLVIGLLCAYVFPFHLCLSIFGYRQG
jgi:hypothetical protein